jgi:hypothetical protein
MTVHDVYVNHPGAGVFDDPDLFTQARKIRR